MAEPEPIRTSPLELYRRLRGTQHQCAELLHEVNEIRREYERLRAHPAALAVDDLDTPVDPVNTTEAVVRDLTRIGGGLWQAHDQLEATRSEHAIRLKLTDAAADDLARRTHRRGTRTR